MTELPRRHDVTITVNRDGGGRPDPAEFAVAAEQAASARAASIVSAHTASQIISIVTVLAADQSAAVASALAVVSDALKRPVASSTR
jgi:DNA-binding transcriptional regulator YdaS (Cro superfamily)